MDVDNIDDDDDWKATGQTLVGTNAQGEEALFSLQKKGSSFRVTPKGKSKGKGKHGPPQKQQRSPEKSGDSKWDPAGCKRCGRSDHWAGECYATKCVDGGKPREKPSQEKG